VAPTATQDRHGTRWSAYVHGFIPVCQALVKEGKIDSWGITGVGQPATIIRALHHHPRPAVVEVISNGGDYVGELKLFRGDARCREIIQVAQAHQVTVLGIRASGAGTGPSGVGAMATGPTFSWHCQGERNERRLFGTPVRGWHGRGAFGGVGCQESAGIGRMLCRGQRGGLGCAVAAGH
jgi:hypothetical protein